MWFGGPHQAPQGAPDDIRRNNEGLLALAKQRPKLQPVAIVHPYAGQAALDELARLAGAGVKLIKLHTHTHTHTQQLDVDDPCMLVLARKVGEPGLVVLVENANIRARVRTGNDFFMDNLCFDLPTTALLAADSPIAAEFVWTLRNIGIGQLLLGSDNPQMPPGKTLDTLERLDLSDEEKTAIRVGNARRLLGLDE